MTSAPGTKRAAIHWDEVRNRIQASEDSLRRSLPESPERIAMVFRQRAVRLAKEHAENEPAARAIPALVVRVANERYAIALKELAEVLPFHGCARIPGTSRQFLGVINLRGDLRPVIDLAWVVSGSASTDSGAVLILRQPAALKVDRVEELLEITPPGITTRDQTPSTQGHYVRTLASGTLALLDVESMLSAVVSPKEFRPQ